MRDILFRGKRVDNGEWVYGFYNRCEARLTYTEEHYKNNPRSWIQTLENEGFAGQLVHVDTDTVGQYIGLNEANGNRIFEGDIVKARFKSNRSIQKFVVYFLNGFYIFDNDYVNVTAKDIDILKVIGNIHDNPDMLKDKGEG